jgi:hypothetical protein
MRIPQQWNWCKHDKRNIIALAHLHGMKGVNTFPAIGTTDFVWYHFVRGIRWTSFLDYIPYNKFSALDHLEKEYGYKRYPYKHYESVFTRFYQGFILPGKFKVDKRKVHLATLVASGQMTREDALKGLEGIPYPSVQDLESDISYFLKKMRWTRDDLNVYLARP